MPRSATSPAGTEPNRIVSSNHLVSAKSPELSEFEYGMIVAWHAFSRWMMYTLSLPDS